MRSAASVPRAAARTCVAAARNSSTNAIFAPRLGLGRRQSNTSDVTVTVFGSYGFVGRYVVNELGSTGTRTYAPYRGDDMEIRHLKPMFDLGQLAQMPFSPRDKDSIRDSLRYTDVVINLIGKHYETKNALPTLRADGKYSRVNYAFGEVNATIPETLAQLAKEAGVKGFIHVSALSADENSASQWSRTKAQGEAAVKKIFPEAVIVKLATVFGPEDRFLNWVAEATKRLPFFPLLNDGSNLVQPVYAGDVGKGVMEVLKHYNEFAGQTFQFAGPSEYSHKEVAEFVQDVTLHHKKLVDVPVSWARNAGKVLEHTIAPFWTEDMVSQLLEDVVAKKDPSLRTLQDLGVEPTHMDQLAFNYLHRFREGGHFARVSGYH